MKSRQTIQSGDHDPSAAYIPRQHDTGRFNALILTGRPGIGKTSFASRIFGETAPLARIPMSTRTPEDFGAYPVPDHDARRIDQYLSEVAIEPLLQKNIGEGYGCLVLDDVTIADPRLQGAILELVQFGVIAGETLGINVLIILTGNGVEDGSYASAWSGALLGRALFVSKEPDFDVWLELQDNKSIDPVVVAFLKDHPKFFAPEFGDRTCADEFGKTPSPRDWSRLGMALDLIGGRQRFKKTELFQSPEAYYSSMVGSIAGVAFASYARMFERYPSGEEIYSDLKCWQRLPKTDRDSLGAALSVTLSVINYTSSLLLQNKAKGAQANAERSAILQRLLTCIQVIGAENNEIFQWALGRLVKSTAPKSELAHVRSNLANIVAALAAEGNNQFVKFLKYYQTLS
jgi:hypothetical protein